MKTIIKGPIIVNEGEVFKADLLIEGEFIKQIGNLDNQLWNEAEIIDAEGLYLLPGLIDDQVHFREPGLTHKGEIYTEAKAAVAGGITSYMEMPNTVPQALTQELLQDKYDLAAKNSLANYSFFMGASNNNIDEVLKTDPKTVCGVKIFMGSSTGDMLVDDQKVLENIFSKSKSLIAVHCEDEATVRANMEEYLQRYGEDVPIHEHPNIRSAEACFRSSSLAVQLAKKHDARLHILHISTAKELELFDNSIPLKEKRITSEACIHHLWFTSEDYEDKGTLIKWNPAVKLKSDRDAIRMGVIENTIDVIATDHAPHTSEEKAQTYFKAPSGGPLVQHALLALLELHHEGVFSLERIVNKTSHSVADIFEIDRRGYIRPGYFADLVLVDLDQTTTVKKDNILYKCGLVTI